MPKRLPFLLLLLALSPARLFAQDYSVRIQSGIFTPTYSGALAAEPAVAAEVMAGHYYRCIQFYAIPGEEEKSALRAKGITLHNYLPTNTYTARIPADFSFASLGTLGSNIRAVFKLEASRKVSTELATRKYPAHALRPGGAIELTAVQQPGLSNAGVAALLQRDGITLTGTIEATGTHRIIIPVSSVLAVADLPYIAYLEPAEPTPTPENTGGRTSHRSNTLATSYATGLKYDGAGVTVALNDDGFIGPHIDYTGRIAAQYVTPNYGNHGDHCAGIIFGAGNRNPTARGMASGATLRVYEAAYSGPSGYQAFDSIYSHYQSQGVRITSTSYSDGTNTGYTTRARLMDTHIGDLPELMHVFSSGNAGASGNPSTWYNITGGHKMSKNTIAVGNLDSLDNLNSSSSRGPAHDGRIKPDVCAVGTNVQSTINPNVYDNFTGTSMACPGVAGTLAQLYQAWKGMNGGQNPKSALIKAAVLNTADDLGNPGPDFKHGWGRINARRAYALLQSNSFFNDSLSQAGVKTHTVTVPAGTSELRVMAYWHDQEATAGALKALVNNLDLKVTTPASATVLPWKLNPAANATTLNQNAFQGVDSLNNMEQVTIPAPAAGTYTVTMTGTAVPQGPQPYFVVYEFVQPSLTLTYPIGGEALVPGVSETVRWDAYGSAGTFTLEYSTDSGASWSTIAGNIAAAQRHYNWTPLATVTGRGLIRVTRGSVSDVSDAAFSVIGVPASTTVNWVCVDSMQISYASVTGATRYVVSVLGATYMDSVASSTTTTCVVRGLNTLVGNWYSVHALGANGAKGRRTIAQLASAVPFNCTVPADVTLLSIQTPASTLTQCTGGTTVDSVRVVVKNNGINVPSNITVGYSLNGGAPVTATLPGSFTALASRSFTLPQPITLTTAGTYTLKVWTQYGADAVPSNDTAVRTVTLNNIAPLSLPVAQDFETSALCDTAANCAGATCALSGGWTNAATDSIDWRVWHGPTPSNALTGTTGPFIDFKPGIGAGRYAYLEANGCYGKTAHLVSPCIDLTGVADAALSWGYHMMGPGTGELHVDVLADGLWTPDVAAPLIGAQGTVWKTGTTSLALFAGKVIQVRFRGITGPTFESDIAVDGIQIFSATGVAPRTAAAFDVRIHPNPSAAGFSVTLTGITADVELTVTDLNGRVVERQTAQPRAGTASVTLQLRGSSAGVYFLNLRGADGLLVRKLVKL